jgi:predicted RND superfamily exporter protein
LKIKRLSRLVILVIFILTSGSIFVSSDLQFDYDFEKFFPKGDPESTFFFDFRDSFRSDNDFVIIGAKREAGVFDHDFLSQVDALSDSLKNLRHVESVYSVTNFKEPIISGGVPFSRPILDFSSTENIARDSARLVTRPEYIGTFISPDLKSVGIQVLHKEYLSKLECDTLGKTVQKLVRSFGFEESHAIGRCIGQDIYISMMQSEMVLFMGLSMLMIVIFLVIAFRSWWGVWVPLMVVLLAIVWNLGVMYLLGQKIDVMLTVLPTIIFVVGMSDVVHIISKYFEELRSGLQKMEALKIAFKEIGVATFLTSLTTGIGFLTLMTSTIEPIRNFGLYTAIGVFLAYILAFSLLPAILALRKAPEMRTTNPREVFWTRWMHHGLRWVLGHKRAVLIGSAVVIGVGIWGASQIEVNNFILEDLKEDHFLKQEFDYFGDNFAGARGVEVAVLFEDSATFYQLETLQELAEVQRYLETVYGIGSFFTPITALSGMNRTTSGGSDAQFRLPETQAELDKLFRKAARVKGRNPIDMVYSPDNQWARMAGKMPDLGKQIYDEKDRVFEAHMAANHPNAPFSITLTGTGHLIDLNNEQLSSTMLKGLAIAFVIIGIIAMLMFRSWKMVIISLIPNVLPLLLIAGFMGFSGIYLKASTAIIFTIAFGIAVDDTIHFLSKFRLELSKEKHWLYALKRTYISTGKAIVVTTLILCAGFLSLVFSEFLGTFYIGLLISMTLVFAVLSDLVLLPVLIILFFRKKKS